MQKVIYIFIILSLFFPATTFAAPRTINDAENFLGKAYKPTGLPEGTVSELVGTFIKGALTIVGLIFFILMVYGGFRWMTAKGNEENITKAKETIIAGVIGLIVILGAYTITTVIVTLTQNAAAPKGICVPQPSLPSGCGSAACETKKIDTCTAGPASACCRWQEQP